MLDFNVSCRKKHLIVASMVLFEAFAGKLYFSVSVVCWTLMFLAAKVIYCGIHGFIQSIRGKLYFILSVGCWTLLFHMLDFNATCGKKHLIVALMVLFEAFAGKLYFSVSVVCWTLMLLAAKGT